MADPAASAAAQADLLVRSTLHLGSRTAAASGRALATDRPLLGLSDLSLHVAAFPAIPDADYLCNEASWINALSTITRDAGAYISLVYAYRGCCRAIPGLNTSSASSGGSGAATSPTAGSPTTPTSPSDPGADPAARAEFFKLVEQVIKPEVDKMKGLMEFYESAVPSLINVCKDAAAALAGGTRPTDPFMVTLAHAFDMLLVLDALKNVKTSLNNDFTLVYRRSRTLYKASGNDVEIHTLGLFLANKDVLLSKLKAAIPGIPSAVEFLWEFSHALSDRLDRGHYATPRGKFALVKAAAYAMALADPLLVPKTMQLHKWKPDRLSRMFRAHPVVPFYGDLAIETAQILGRTLQIKWDLTPVPGEAAEVAAGSISTGEAGEAALVGAVGMIGTLGGGSAAAITGGELIPIHSVRMRYTDYLAKLALAQDAARRCKDEDMLDAQCRDVFETFVEGLQLVNHLAVLILEMNAYKYTHPTSHGTDSACPETALNYEMAIRFNYRPDEKLALIETLSMVKALAIRLERASIELERAITKHIQCTMYSFQMSLTNMTAHTAKKKKSEVHGLLKALAELASPSTNSSEALTYMASAVVQWALRAAAVKPTGFMKDKELKDTHVAELAGFAHQLYWMDRARNVTATLRETTDLSELWFKEFYLELSKTIQFPIETSLPWILIEKLMEPGAVDLTSSLFVPFAIYDDAAQRALRGLKMEYLYEEIESEANLALDLFLFKFTEKVFKAYKCRAASDLFPTLYKTKFDKNALLDGVFHQYEEILDHYDTISILGRTIQLRQVFAQWMNLTFRDSLRAIISRFESMDITGIVELDVLLRIARLTHTLLHQRLPGMDEFDDILAEVDESLVAHGRIVSHLAAELTLDFCLQFAYNAVTERFIRCPIKMTEGNGVHAGRAAAKQHRQEYLFGNKALAGAYTAQLSPCLLFVGKHHFDAIVRVLGPRIPVLFGQIVTSFEERVGDKLTPYIWALCKEFPSNLHLPNLDAGVVMTFNYFQVTLKAALAFKDLTTVFQTLREMGNLFACVRLLELSMIAEDVLDAFTYSKVFDAARELERAYKLPPLPADFYATGAPGSGQALAFSRMFLLHMYPMMQSVQAVWSEGLPPSTSYDTSRELYRVASFLQFSFCSGSQYTKGHTCREVFGDGVAWALGLLLCWTRQLEVFSALDFTFHVCHAGKIHGVPNGPIPAISADGSTGAGGALHVTLPDFIAIGEYYRALMAFIGRFYRATVASGGAVDQFAGPGSPEISITEGGMMVGESGPPVATGVGAGTDASGKPVSLYDGADGAGNPRRLSAIGSFAAQ
ncbi:cytoplasmic fragile-X interacting family-domain-containing protein [Blastocladiella britannica]|nr:cytoplasmic fragile-X interacting family-domain-containing protein [Blastocladiella britannica]